MPPTHVGVIGGGISGLAASFHLARKLPGTRITLFEKSKHLGGWLKSERIEIEGENVVVEAGPRTLRPNSLALLELVSHPLPDGKDQCNVARTSRYTFFDLKAASFGHHPLLQQPKTGFFIYQAQQG
jgi:protoporphyrinogen oxidase